MSDDSLRLLYVTKGLDIGGLERLVASTAIGLTNRGHHVDVAVVNGRRDRLASVLESEGVYVVRLAGSDRLGARGMLGLWRLLRSGAYDVVHVHGPLPAVAARLVPGAPPLVTTSHTPLGALRSPTRLLWNATSRRDAGSIAVSESVRDSMRELDAARCVVVPHGIDADSIQTTAAATGAERGDDGVVTVIAVASHRAAKNYPNLLRAVVHAAERGATLRLVAIGEGPELERHRRLAVELGIDELVTFEPTTLEVLPRIAAADLLVVSSDWEGQPLVASEALALGTPVVATAVGRVDSMVTADVGRIVPPRDHEALGDALAELARDSELRATMSQAAIRRAADWTLDSSVSAYESVYRKVIEGGAGT